MRFLLEYVPCCGSSTYHRSAASASTSLSLPLPLPAFVVSEHQIEEAIRSRKRARRRISRSMSAVDWRPSLASIYEDDFDYNKELAELGDKKQQLAGSEKKKKENSAISVAKLNARSYSFDVNDFGPHNVPSMNSGLCASPFMI